MDQPARGGRREDPGQGMFPPFGPIKHTAGNQSAQGAGTDAQKNTFQRTFAHGGGKHRVSGPHIEGRGFPHGRQAKHCSHGRSLLGPQHTAGHQDRNIDKRQRDRFNMDISKEGKGHEKLYGDQRPKNIFVVHRLLRRILLLFPTTHFLPSSVRSFFCPAFILSSHCSAQPLLCPAFILPSNRPFLASLILLPDYRIFIPVPVIGTLKTLLCAKPHIIVLIHIRIAQIRVVFLIINIIRARITACSS